MKLTVVGKGQDAKNIAYGLQCERFTLAADLAIRYGNVRVKSKVSGKPFVYGKELNFVEAINNARNKFMTLLKLAQKEISVPPFTEQSDNIPLHDGIWFGRDKYHTQGLDIVIVDTSINAPTLLKDYYIKYIPIRKEYRVHVFRDKIIQACIKYKEAGNDGAGGTEDMIRNLEHGWKFSEIENCNHNVKDLAIKSVKALGLDFGAVDIIKGQDGLYYVLEVNTAPGLDSKRLAAYIECFKNYIIGLETPNVKMAAKIKYPDWFVNISNRYFQGRAETSIDFIKEYLSHVRH